MIKLLLEILSKPKSQLHDFLDGNRRNAYVSHNGYSIYLRKSQRLINGEMRPMVDVANISSENFKKQQINWMPEGQRKGTGKLRQTFDDIEQAAKARQYHGVYVEQVQNRFLPEVLERYGYAKHEQASMFETSYHKLFS